MTQFKVSPGGSVILPNQKIIGPGVEVPTGLSETFYKSAQESRHIVEVQNIPQVGRQNQAGVERSPGSVEMPALKLVSTSGEQAITEIIELNAPTSPPVNIPGSDHSPWVIDPALLADKTVEELNAMILERAPEEKPFTTIEEARAFLTQDFKPQAPATQPPANPTK